VCAMSCRPLSMASEVHFGGVAGAGVVAKVGGRTSETPSPHLKSENSAAKAVVASLQGHEGGTSEDPPGHLRGPSPEPWRRSIGALEVVNRSPGGGQSEPWGWSIEALEVVDRSLGGGRSEPWRWSFGALEVPMTCSELRRTTPEASANGGRPQERGHSCPLAGVLDVRLTTRLLIGQRYHHSFAKLGRSGRLGRRFCGWS
jgi:hypothetical protein